MTTGIVFDVKRFAVPDGPGICTTVHVYFGSLTSTTPHGRLADRFLPEGLSPVQGADRRGPTVVLKSVSKTDHIRTGGRPLNQEPTPQVLEDEDDLEKFVHPTRTYFNLDGRAAQENPKRYRDLMVRVARYSDYFCDLGMEVQEEIIARTKHEAL